jgi:hypothetical protein
MQLVKISGDCGKDDCPAIYMSEGEDRAIIVRGDIVEATPGVGLAAGEALVKIPFTILEGAIDAVGR